MSLDKWTVTSLPGLRRALERRYPGVQITHCEHRQHEDGREGIMCVYSAPLGTLVSYDLARVVSESDRSGRMELIAGASKKEFEITGSGSAWLDERDAYVCHHCYDRDPPMPGKRQWPPKWVEKEVARIWRRLAKGSPRRAAPTCRP